LGQTLEPQLGRARFALVYFASMLGGSAGALLLQPDGLHGGASGAVFGLFGLVTAGYLMRGINPLTTSLGGVLLINAFLSLRPGISFGGHLGGAVAGVLCGLVVVAPSHRRLAERWSYLVPVGVIALSVAICIGSVASAG
jgi:membrane associated rhomboid family serine protease